MPEDRMKNEKDRQGGQQGNQAGGGRQGQQGGRGNR